MTGVRINNLNRNAWNRVTHGTRFVTRLRFRGIDYIGKIDRDDGCQLGASVAFQ